ncbi:MAG: 2-C-methyl-D-erythritol 4-phosphate cytidylyltransferase [bacterium]
MKNIVIIVAGGQGKRMGKPKQFLRIAGKPMLDWTVAAFQKCKEIDGIVLVVSEEQLALAKKIKAGKIIAIIPGGKERQDSVRNGLAELPASTEIVAIHDGARPGVSVETIERSIDEAKKLGAIVVGVPVKDTVKKVMSNGERVMGTLNRNELWAAQTPQTFQVEIIKKAYDKLTENVTDDAMAVEKLGIPVKMVMGEYTNIKVTTPEDLSIMASILKKLDGT